MENDDSLSGILDDLKNQIAHYSGGSSGGFVGGINSGLSTAAGLLQTYWSGQEAVNRAQAAAEAAKYGAASQNVAQASSNLSTLTVPLLGVGAMIALSIALHNSTAKK